VRLLLDEMFPPALAEQLRRRGHDVEAVKEHPALIGLPDPEVFAHAQATERVLVTENVSDYLLLDAEYRAAGRGHAGLIFTSDSAFPRGRRDTLGALVAALDSRLATGEISGTALL
jgi:hypothetical protein